MNKNKIILLISSTHNQDNFRVFHREFKALEKEGFSVVYITQEAYRGEQSMHPNIHLFKKIDNKYFRILVSQFYILQLILQFKKVHVLHLHTPELIPLGVGFKIFGKKIVYEAHDNLPEQIKTKDWIPFLLKPFLSILSSMYEKIADYFFDRIIIVEPTNALRFKENKTVIIRNFPMDIEFGSMNISNYKERSNNLVYIGQIFRKRGILDYVKALEFIPQSYNVKLHLAGNISTQKLRKELIELKGWDRVHYYGYVNRERALQIYSISKIGLLVLDDNKKYQQSDPVKLFEYMAAGIPFIMSNFTVWNKLLHKTKVALTCTYNSPKELAKHIIYLLDNKEQAAEMAANARMLYEKHYSWELQERLFLNVYKNLLV